MTTSASSDNIPPAWDLSALDTPTVLDVPKEVPEHPQPLLIDCLEALVAFLVHDTTASLQIRDIACAGVVALRTSTGCLEVHETLLGWIFVHSWGDPDPADLAVAARLRAHRLASERHHDSGSTS